MAAAARLLTVAVVGGLVGVGTPTLVRAQASAQPSAPPDSRAVFAVGSIVGSVRDERGVPVSGASVSALGASTSSAVTDKDGRFDFGTLAPGPYLIRVYHAGFVAERAHSVLVSPSTRTMSPIAIRRVGAVAQILAAGASGPVDVAAPPPVDSDVAVEKAQPRDEGETAWRVRHARRSVLKDVTLPAGLVTDDGDTFAARAGSDPWTVIDVLGRAVGSPARAATSLFTDPLWSGQINLLATSSFDGSQQLFSGDNLPRNMAYVRFGAPAGSGTDWVVRGILTSADVASRMIAGSYRTRASARHRYDVGLSYSAQRYEGGGLLALRDVAYGTRDAGSVYAYDSFSVSPSTTVTYGGRYGRYDYLKARSLVSPRVELTVVPADRLRLTAAIARNALAPGAEEFLPPNDLGLWLPPQRMFTSLENNRPFEAERTTSEEVSLERDFGGSTIVIRAFRQHVNGQLVTVFGSALPGRNPEKPGHYIVGNAGDADASGCGAAFRTLLLGRVRSSVEYSMSNARMSPYAEVRDLTVLAPSALLPRAERIHDLSTSLETEVPETSTRVMVLYRMSNGFAHPHRDSQEAEHSMLDGRFDVQIRQSLPFMNFSNARWEMLVAVRNFFRDAATEQSVYDELLVVSPPKRVVGGVTLSF